MKILKITASALALAIAMTGCAKNSEIDRSGLEVVVSSVESSSNPSPTVSESSTSTEPPESNSPKVFPLTSLGEVINESPVGEIEVCSVNQALERFDEILNKKPEGTPEEIVRTLMERNVLCFAAMYGKCWSQDGEGYGVKYDNTEPRYIPIKSDYIESTEQLTQLFYNTYTFAEAEHLLHPFDVFEYCYTFFYNDGKLYYDLDQLREFHGESFSEPTRATIVSASEDEITFGRVGDTNNFLFKAVKEDDEWVLETFVYDAPAYSPMYTKLVTTKRAGNNKVIELAKSQVGAIGGMKYCNWYGFDFRTEWCAIFVSWAYGMMGLDEPNFALCDTEGQEWFADCGRWQPRGYADIAPGDCIFFDWDNNGYANHVGLVVGRDDKYVYTIEGNRSDSCIANKYELNCPDIIGYGLMTWD